MLAARPRPSVYKTSETCIFSPLLLWNWNQWVHDDPNEHETQMAYATQLFDQLGFTINLEKSVLSPSHTCITEHLGFILNSTDMTVTLTDHEKLCVKCLAGKILSKSRPTITELAQFFEKLIATEPSFNFPSLYYKEIESLTRSTLERRATLSHLRSTKPNMINHFAN